MSIQLWKKWNWIVIYKHKCDEKKAVIRFQKCLRLWTISACICEYDIQTVLKTVARFTSHNLWQCSTNALKVSSTEFDFRFWNNAKTTDDFIPIQQQWTREVFIHESNWLKFIRFVFWCIHVVYCSAKYTSRIYL